MIPSLLADVYGRQWRSLVHADVLRAALDVAWVRTRRAHPRVEGVDSWNRFAPGIKRMARCKRFLGVGDGAPCGLNPVEALAKRAGARRLEAGHKRARGDGRVPPPPARPFWMANVGSGANGFAEVAAWLVEPVSNASARVDLRVFSVDNDPAWEATVTADVTDWRTWLHPALDKFFARSPRRTKRQEREGRFDYVHFSPPCTAFTIMKQSCVAGAREIEEAVWLGCVDARSSSN